MSGLNGYWVYGCVAGLCALGVACEETPKSGAAAAATASVQTLKTPKKKSIVIPVSDEPKAPETADEPKPKKTLEDCTDENAVEFPSDEFEAAVRLKLQKPDGEITKADLKRLRSLNLTRAKLDELDICLFRHMTNLRELFLGPGKYDDLSPIAGAKHLESLRASLNNVSDISPLEGMKNLDRLDLGKTKVTDLSPLSELKNLTELMLDGTPVSDVSPLAGLTKLERLGLKGTKVEDVSMLADLKALKFLYVRDTPADEKFEQFAPLRRNGTKIMSD